MKVVSEFKINDYMVLKLNEKILSEKYNAVIINDKVYKLEPLFDAFNCIAFKNCECRSFIGETVEFVLV